MKKLKILEITAFSAGIDGGWARIKSETSLLSKKYDVTIFSSNIKRGSGKIELAPEIEKIGSVKIHRFPTFYNFGQNTFFWKFEKAAEELKPDIIITHFYRQYYATKALKLARKLQIPCILVTHAPFLETKLRNWKLNAAVFLYDKIIGRDALNKYSKIFAITKWEVPFLIGLGADKQKIEYVPNGIPEEFFKIKLQKEENKTKKLLFLARIAPVKDIETLIRAFAIVQKQIPNLQLDLVGPIEKDYNPIIRDLMKRLNIKINFLGPVYDIRKKIEIIDSCDIFILPSKREAMPQSLIEAMARKKLVISSSTDGGKEIVEDNKTGLLFDIGNEHQLAAKILFALDTRNKGKIKKIEEAAHNSVKQFSWQVIIEKIEKIINQLVNKSL